MKKVLFVCTGNICRSPMAEGLFNHKILSDENNDNFVAWSAGVYAEVGMAPTNYAVEAVKEYGVDIKKLRAKDETIEMIRESHLVLAMTNGHKRALVSRYPDYTSRIYTLHEYANMDTQRNVEDPYGYPLKVYNQCAAEISEAIDKVIKRLHDKSNDNIST